ncbi:ANTAR domain-containing protein [Streptomyces sp. NPDC059788]|uniref:ANTAR domain-containing protein n=1 Tax=Streptomyces sp. NPDC059788 TaxID=3346948 RepID=UPI0036686BCF
MSDPPYPSSRDLRPAQTPADATASSLAARRQLTEKDQVLGQLQTALDSRLIIEQAKGGLSARLGISLDEAFQRLRAHARARAPGSAAGGGQRATRRRRSVAVWASAACSRAKGAGRGARCGP